MPTCASAWHKTLLQKVTAECLMLKHQEIAGILKQFFLVAINIQKHRGLALIFEFFHRIISCYFKRKFAVL